jgi:hypothetical protein
VTANPTTSLTSRTICLMWCQACESHDLRSRVVGMSSGVGFELGYDGTPKPVPLYEMLACLYRSPTEALYVPIDTMLPRTTDWPVDLRTWAPDVPAQDGGNSGSRDVSECPPLGKRRRTE